MNLTELRDAIELLATAEDLAEIQMIVRRTARSVVQADGATFVLREDDKCFYADEDAISPLWKGQRFPITSCISGWSMLNDQPAVVGDITIDERIPLDAYKPTFVQSLAMVPIGRGNPVGAIGTYWATNHMATRDEVNALLDLAAGASDAIGRVGLDDAPFTPTLLTDAATS